MDGCAIVVQLQEQGSTAVDDTAHTRMHWRAPTNQRSQHTHRLNKSEKAHSLRIVRTELIRQAYT